MIRPDLTPEMARAAADACVAAAERKHRMAMRAYRDGGADGVRRLAHEIGVLQVAARYIEAAIPSEYPAEATEGELRMLAGDR